ncbi:MAG TPA: hypothetical protein VFQ42_04100 [Mycobacterium sp.]|nr:hypothetical protein [Mycobacterium sp.]
MAADINRLDVPRLVPNRAQRRRVRVHDRPVPTLDEARMLGYVTKQRMRALAVAAVMGDAFDVSGLAVVEPDGAE